MPDFMSQASPRPLVITTHRQKASALDSQAYCEFGPFSVPSHRAVPCRVLDVAAPRPPSICGETHMPRMHREVHGMWLIGFHPRTAARSCGPGLVAAFSRYLLLQAEWHPRRLCGRLPQQPRPVHVQPSRFPRAGSPPSEPGRPAQRRPAQVLDAALAEGIRGGGAKWRRTSAVPCTKSHSGRCFQQQDTCNASVICLGQGGPREASPPRAM